MAPQDNVLYTELGVKRDASPNIVKHAYRRLAKDWHPDRNPDGLEKFKRLNAAYQVLSDPAQRKKYDSQGFKAVLHRDPESWDGGQDDSESAVQDARAEFDDFLDGLDDDVDQEVDDLLEWWSDSKLDTSNAKSCLRLESDDFFDQLVAVYDQYRLTHHATTNDKRSKTVTPGEAVRCVVLLFGR